MIRLDILSDKLDELDVRITRYANDNLKEIIRVLLDFLEDDNDFSIWDVIPRNATSISCEEWIKLLYNLYDIVCARALRDYIKPKYQYLLYLILLWWKECNEEGTELLPVELEKGIAEKICMRYPSENGESYVLRAITTFEEYFYIFLKTMIFYQSN